MMSMKKRKIVIVILALVIALIITALIVNQVIDNQFQTVWQNYTLCKDICNMTS